MWDTRFFLSTLFFFFFFQRTEAVKHEENKYLVGIMGVFFFFFKHGFMLEILGNIFFPQIKLHPFILLFSYFLTSKIPFSLKPTRNLINSVLMEHKIIFLKYNTFYRRK